MPDLPNYSFTLRPPAFFIWLIPFLSSYISDLLFQRKYPVMFTGETGVGKTVLAVSTLKKLSVGNIVPVQINFSAQTSSIRTQEMIEGPLEKRKRTQLGAPIGKSVIVFIDDVNMPKLDTYGSQPAIELLRLVCVRYEYPQMYKTQYLSLDNF